MQACDADGDHKVTVEEALDVLYTRDTVFVATAGDGGDTGSTKKLFRCGGAPECDFQGTFMQVTDHEVMCLHCA